LRWGPLGVNKLTLRIACAIELLRIIKPFEALKGVGHVALANGLSTAFATASAR
jgi:hypothetical protein